ncbi:hypothetical protein [Actinorugispora endophytica]|uniref:Uncharacterized protein n=1 Tax=Actinorugispora endophytica TaxID=1605990 RepID=A0A4R6UAE6_9ACTN|nr:hypothetical protein [Actinorugispora endophytica]TDQ43600.1 hypothetical protein EV190_14114 [Actinorugispora endophytica]
MTSSLSVFLPVLLSHGPVFLIAVFGLVLALANPIRSRALVVVAMLLLLVSALFSGGWQIVVTSVMRYGGGGTFAGADLSLVYGLVGLVSTLLQVACWALVFVALFRPGPARPPRP